MTSPAHSVTNVTLPKTFKRWVSKTDAGRDWGQEKKGTTEDEMGGWHHWLDGRESQWTPGVGDGQGGRRAVIHGVEKSRTWLSDWSDLIFPQKSWAKDLYPHHSLLRKTALGSPPQEVTLYSSLPKEQLRTIVLHRWDQDFNLNMVIYNC